VTDVVLLLLAFFLLFSGASLCCTVNAYVTTQLRTVPFQCPRNLFSESIAPAVQKGFSPEVCWEGRCVNFLSAIKGFSYLSAENRLNLDKPLANL